MKIALISLDQKWEDKENNFKQCESLLHSVSSVDIDLAVFPELTLTGFSVANSSLVEPLEGSPTIKGFQDLALSLNTGMIFGLIQEDAAGKFENNMVCLDQKGEILSSYTKMHPFSLGNEHELFASGGELSIATMKVGTDNIKIGSTICYDLRFPEVYSSYEGKCDLLVNIANWPARRIDHWEILLKARAVESFCYTVGVNRTGTDPNEIEYEKSSYIFDPFGRKIEPIESDGVVDVFSIDIDRVEQIRNKLPFHADRRPELYGQLSNTVRGT